MKLKHILVPALLFVFNAAFAQTLAEKEELLKGFDEAEVIKEAKKKGIHASEIKGYVSCMKSKYVYDHHPEIHHTEKETAGKIAFINLTRQSNEQALNAYCQNLDFANLNYSNWTGAISTSNVANPGAGYPTVSSWQSNGINGNNGSPIIINTDPTAFTASTDRHVIMNMPIGALTNNPANAFANGYDPVCQNFTTGMFDLPMVPYNGATSLRLGSQYANETCEKISYAITVGPNNTQFTYQFAVVLNSGGTSHSPGYQPAFVFQLLNSSGTQIGGNCGVYIKDAGQAESDTSFILSNAAVAWGFNGDSTFYRKWHTATVDLTPWMGQTIYAEFYTTDCAYSAHCGYAYITATCGDLTANVSGFCGGAGTAVMNAPPGFYTYQWYFGNGTAISGADSSVHVAHNVTPNDSFFVYMTTVQGCTTKLKVTVNASNIVAIPNSVGTCRGGSHGSASVNVLGGPAFSYTWSPGGANTSSISNLAPGDYTVHIVDQTGNCPPKDTVVNVPVILPPLQTNTVQLCGDHLSPPLQVPSGGLPGYTWYSSITPGVVATTATYVPSGTVAASDYFTVTYMDPSTGCLDSLKTTMSPVFISFSTVPQGPCNGGNNGVIIVNPSGGNSFTNYDWSCTGTAGGTNVAIPPALQIGSLAAGNYTITISQAGNPSCSYTTTVQLVQDGLSPPTLDTLKGCAAQALSIPTFTTSGSTHSWYGPGGVSLGTSYPYITSGVANGDVYTDTIRNAFGCKSVYKAYLKEMKFNGSITAPEKIKCHDDSTGKLKVTINSETNGPIGSNYIFNWVYPSPYTSPATITGGSTVPQSSQETNLHPGTYTCVVHSGACVKTFTYALTNPALLPDDSLFSYFCPKDSIAWVFAEPGHSQYNWMHNGVPIPGYNNDSLAATPATVGEYIVWYLVSGCRDTARILYTFPSYHALRPDKLVNVFTPNGDDRNDRFFPFHDDQISQYEIDKQMEFFEIVIYNRWGKKVFETTEYANPWDGITDGKAQDDGTYYYIMRYKSNCGTKADIVEKHGFVQLLR